MYKSLAIFNGFLISIMVLLNSMLAKKTTLLFSLAIVYSLCLLIVTGILLLKRTSLKNIRTLPKYMYTVGLIGLINTAMNSISFINLGAALTMGLLLYGQLVSSAIVDFGGYLGLKKQPFHPKKLIGIGIMSLGILIMILV